VSCKRSPRLRDDHADRGTHGSGDTPRTVRTSGRSPRRCVGPVLDTLDMINPLATWPVTSMRCSRIASEAPKPPRALSVQPVVRCARMRKPSKRIADGPLPADPDLTRRSRTRRQALPARRQLRLIALRGKLEKVATTATGSGGSQRRQRRKRMGRADDAKKPEGAKIRTTLGQVFPVSLSTCEAALETSAQRGCISFTSADRPAQRGHGVVKPVGDRLGRRVSWGGEPLG
jgi:hypothetical protein